MSFAVVALAIGSAFVQPMWNLLARGQRDRETMFLRMLIIIASVGLVPVVVGEYLYTQMTPTAWWCAAAAGFFGGMYYFFLGHSYNKTDFTTAYPVIRALPVMLIALADVARGNFIPWQGWLAIAMVAMGCLLSTLTRFREFSFKRFFHHSFALILTAAIGTVGYTIFDKIASESIRAAGATGLGGLAGALKYQWAMLTAALVAFVGFQCFFFPGHRKELLAQGGPKSGWVIPAAVAALVFLGYGMILWAFQLDERMAYISSMRQFSIVIGVVLAFAVFHEKGFFVRTTGALLITGGVVLIALLPVIQGQHSTDTESVISGERPMATCKRVFIIGLDGLRGPAVNETETRNIDAFMHRAAYTTHAQSVMPSASYQAWGAMLHGVGPEVHQIGGSTPITEDVSWPSFIKIANQQRPELRVGAYCAWTPIITDIIEQSCVCDTLSLSDRELMPAALEYIRNEKPDIFYIHLDIIDGTGHTHGYQSAKYHEAIRLVDGWVGDLLEAAESMGDFEETLVIVLSDHGGTEIFNDEGELVGHSHGTDHEDCMNIFWGAAGPGVIGGELTPNFDIAATAPVVAHALGLDAPAGWEASVPDGLFEDK
jgi:drug/metabolite transporter (DMT)-like permease